MERSIFDWLVLDIHDIATITALNKGEPAAFETVYAHFVRPLRFFIGRFVKDSAAAEDIAAEALTRTFRKHGDFLTMDKLKSYLYTTASRAAIDYYRARHKETAVLEQAAAIHDETIEDVELAYVRTEAIRAINEAIGNLPKQPRQVIRMLFMEGKKLPEIAAELNLSYNTVQNHRQRGLELLRINLRKNRLISVAGLLFALALLEHQ
jgi:RNA polymerase sigma factor (sigma-70 family)